MKQILWRAVALILVTAALFSVAACSVRIDENGDMVFLQEEPEVLPEAQAVTKTKAEKPSAGIQTDEEADKEEAKKEVLKEKKKAAEEAVKKAAEEAQKAAEEEEKRAAEAAQKAAEEEAQKAAEEAAQRAAEEAAALAAQEAAQQQWAQQQTWTAPQSDGCINDMSLMY